MLAGVLRAGSLDPSPNPSPGRIRGTITDSTTGQPLAYTNVLLQGTQLGGVTNSEGFYHIAAVPPGNYVLVISHLGYETRVVPVSVWEDLITTADVLLIPTEIKAQEMIVQGERPRHLDDSNLKMAKITAQEVSMVPAGAEADIFRALQTSPGVGATSDVSARYYVRGGASDQNLVLLNGATVYSPFHTLGIFSVVDPEAVSLLEFYKGGFPPSYGGRLSSILNIVTRDGNRNKLEGIGSASLLSGKVAVEGPIPDGSFLVTGRKSWYSDIMKKYLGNQDAPFDFYDLTWKLSYAPPAIDKNSKFAFHGFLSGDQVLHHDPSQEDYVIHNTIVGMNWHKIWSNPLYSVVSVSYSGFDAAVRPNESAAKPRTNRVTDVTANWDFTYLYDSRDELSFGLQNQFIGTSLALENVYGNRFSFDQQGVDISAYADYRFYRWDRVSLSVGIRFKWVAISEIRPILFEPRFSLTWKVLPWMSLHGAAGIYSQEMLTLADDGELISIFEPWIIVPDYLNSALAYHLAVGAKLDWLNILSTEIEAYYKPISNLAVANPNKYLPTDHDLINADGLSYGVEVLTQYQSVETFARLSYALSWASTTVLGQTVIPRYDVRNALGILVGRDLGGGWEGSVSWTLRSGMPLTPVVGFYDRVGFDPTKGIYDAGPQSPVTVWGVQNSIRLPLYHRMDVSVSREFRLAGASVKLGASILNLYDQRNIFYFDRVTGKPVYMLRFLPSLSVRVQL